MPERSAILDDRTMAFFSVKSRQVEGRLCVSDDANIRLRQNVHCELAFLLRIREFVQVYPVAHHDAFNSERASLAEGGSPLLGCS